MFELTSPFKRIRKPSALKGLTGLDKTRRRAAPAPYASTEKEEFDPTPDEEDRLAHALHDRSLAKQVLGLKKKHPYGTVPELLTLDYLEQHNERYVYQAQLYGGFRQGGVVPDFMIFRQAQALALLVNGQYWHNLPGMAQNDESDKLRMRGQRFEGHTITQAVIVWESRLMQSRQSRDDTLAAALQGIELGP